MSKSTFKCARCKQEIDKSLDDEKIKKEEAKKLWDIDDIEDEETVSQTCDPCFQWMMQELKKRGEFYYRYSPEERSKIDVALERF